MADRVEIVEQAIRDIKQQYPTIDERGLRTLLMRADVADVERLRGAMSRFSLKELLELLE